MRRAMNTIPEVEYNRLLAMSAERMRGKIAKMIDQECTLMKLADHFENYAKAEIHDFNQRALMLALNALYLSGETGEEGETWLVVNKNGSEFRCYEMPVRDTKFGVWRSSYLVPLSKGSIKKLIGKELKWTDSPAKFIGEE